MTLPLNSHMIGWRVILNGYALKIGSPDAWRDGRVVCVDPELIDHPSLRGSVLVEFPPRGRERKPRVKSVLPVSGSLLLDNDRNRRIILRLHGRVIGDQAEQILCDRIESEQFMGSA
jgi:hypothetical protein